MTYYGAAILTGLYAGVILVTHFASPSCIFEQDNECESEATIIWSTDLFTGLIVLLLSIHFNTKGVLKECGIAFVAFGVGYILKGSADVYVSKNWTDSHNGSIAFYLLTCIQYILWTVSAVTFLVLVHVSENRMDGRVRPRGVVPSTISLFFVIVFAVVLLVACVWSMLTFTPIDEVSIQNIPASFEILRYGQLVWQAFFCLFLICCVSFAIGDLSKSQDIATRICDLPTSLAARAVLICQLLVAGLLVVFVVNLSADDEWAFTEGGTFALVLFNYAMLMTFFFIHTMLSSIFHRDNLRGTIEKDAQEAGEYDGQADTDDEFQDGGLQEEHAQPSNDKIQLLESNRAHDSMLKDDSPGDERNDGSKSVRKGKFLGEAVISAFSLINSVTTSSSKPVNLPTSEEPPSLEPKSMEPATEVFSVWALQGENMGREDQETIQQKSNPYERDSDAVDITKKKGRFWFQGRNKKNESSEHSELNMTRLHPTDELKGRTSFESEGTGLDLEDIQLMAYRSEGSSFASEGENRKNGNNNGTADSINASSSISSEPHFSLSRSKSVSKKSSEERSTMFRIASYLELCNAQFNAKPEDNNEQEMEPMPSINFEQIGGTPYGELSTHNRDAGASVDANGSLSSVPKMALSQAPSVLTEASKEQVTSHQNANYLELWKRIFFAKSVDNSAEHEKDSNLIEGPSVLSKTNLSNSDRTAPPTLLKPGISSLPLDEGPVQPVPSTPSLQSTRTRSNRTTYSQKNLQLQANAPAITIEEMHGIEFEFGSEPMVIAEANDEITGEPDEEMGQKCPRQNESIEDLHHLERTSEVTSVVEITKKVPKRQKGKRFKLSRWFSPRQRKSTTSEDNPLPLMEVAAVPTQEQKIEETAREEMKYAVNFVDIDNYDGIPDIEIALGRLEEHSLETRLSLTSLEYGQPNDQDKTIQKDQYGESREVSTVFSPEPVDKERNCSMGAIEESSVISTMELFKTTSIENSSTKASEKQNLLEISTLSNDNNTHKCLDGPEGITAAPSKTLPHEEQTREGSQATEGTFGQESIVKDLMNQPQESLAEDSIIETQESLVEGSMTQAHKSLVEVSMNQSLENTVEDPMTQAEEILVEVPKTLAKESLVEDNVPLTQEGQVEDPMTLSHESLMEDPIIQAQESLVLDPMTQAQESLVDGSRSQISDAQDEVQLDDMSHVTSVDDNNMSTQPLSRTISNYSTVSQLSVSDMRGGNKVKHFVDKHYRTRLVQPVGYSSAGVTSFDDNNMSTPPLSRTSSNYSTVSHLSVSDMRGGNKVKDFVDKHYRTRLVQPVGYSSARVTSLDGKKQDWAIRVARARSVEDMLDEREETSGGNVGSSELRQNVSMAREM